MRQDTLDLTVSDTKEILGRPRSGWYSGTNQNRYMTPPRV